MPTWSGCRVEVVCVREGLVFEDDDVDLRVDDTGIELTYWDDRGAVVFSGGPASDGHFELTCRSRPRRATLHRVAEGAVLEGSWAESDQRGYWRIEIPAPNPA